MDLFQIPFRCPATKPGERITGNIVANHLAPGNRLVNLR